MIFTIFLFYIIFSFLDFLNGNHYLYIYNILFEELKVWKIT